MSVLLLGFVLIACEVILATSEGWPQGTYGLPKPVSGCPPGWKEGWRQQDLENTNPRSSFSTDLQLHMDATLTGGDIKRGFCVKTTTLVGETSSWPAGSYCVYRKNQNCPPGMNVAGHIKWDDEDDGSPNNNNNKHGTLPDGSYDHDTTIYYCCQNEASLSEAMELPVDRPFYLLTKNYGACQQVKGAISTLESITYDTENNNNHDVFNGDHPYLVKKEKGLFTVYYCYYVGCIHKLQDESGTISATRFPDNQYCSWSISVNQGFAVSLTFTSINIPNCDENIMDIRDGLDDTAPLLMRICGDNATSGLKLRSTGNNIFITLTSGKNLGTDIQFQADYNATTPFSGMSWPSGTYSLPKTTTSCPEMWIPGWRKQIMEDDNGKRESSFSPDFHMDASLVDYSLTRHFCTKTFDSEATQKAWPAGKYCIYKKNQCPAGMKEGSIKWDDEDSPKKDTNGKHGILPDGVYGENHEDIGTEIFYCCDDQGQWEDSIELPHNEPFYLLPHQSDDCQRIKWALSTLESITYDTEDANNYDTLTPSHGYATGGDQVPLVVYYCYYKDCEHKLKNDTGSFGMDVYPDYQYCSWSVTVKPYMVVFLQFTTLDIPNCLGNELEIYDGVDSTAPLLATYCGDNATAGNTLRSTGNIVYVVFKSGKSNSLRFQALYKAEERTTEATWPSGTYGLPKSTVACPAGWVQGSRKQDLDGGGGFDAATSIPLHMDTVLDLTDKYINRTFCMKTTNDGQNKLWPKGSYCIYKKNHCSAGMSEGWIYWDDLDTGNSNARHGILPDGQYDVDTRIRYCCRNQGNWYNPIELPVSVPFFLLPHTSKNCQRVKWARSSLEYIKYDTADDQNRDEFKNSHPFTDKQKGSPTIYYCYYEGCQDKINAESPSYISLSSSSTQDFQNCSWLLSVRYGNISLAFSSMSVPGCQEENFIEVYDGPNEQSPVLDKYCGFSTSNTITSTGRHLFVLVNSGNNRQMGTTVDFYATYKNNLPLHITLPPSTTDIKTATTSSTTPATTTERRTTSPKQPSTTPSRSTTTSTQQTTPGTTKIPTQTDVTTRPDAVTSVPKGSTKPSEPKTTTTNLTQEGTGDGQSSGSDDASNSLAIVIPVCVTVLAIVVIVMIFYKRREGKNNSNSRTAVERVALSNEEYSARYQSPNGVEILTYQAKQVNIPCEERDNPIYDSEDHTYSTIDDAKAQYKKELAKGKPSQTTLYDKPIIDSGASTSFNPIYAASTSGETSNAYQAVETSSSPSSLPPTQTQGGYEIPVQGCEPYDKPQPVHYKAPSNEHETLQAKIDAQSGAYDVSP